MQGRTKCNMRVLLKGESKIASLPAMKTDRRSKILTALVLNPDTRWRQVANIALRPNDSQRKNGQYSLNYRLGKFQKRSGPLGEKKNLCPASNHTP